MDGFQYINNTLEFLPHTSTQLSTGAEGYIKATPGGLGGGTNYHFNYVFTYTDHLGNIRLIDAQNPSNNNEVSILEEDHYYPYGLKHVGYNGNHQILFQNDGQITLTDVTPFLGDSHTYKFGGKEYQTEFDINSYDFGARNYDPALGRWMNIDPLAELMRRHSPYNYAFNNPVYYIDPDGRIPIPNAQKSGLFASDTKYLGTSDTSTGGFGSYINVEGGDESTKVYVDKNGNHNAAAAQSKFRKMRKDIANMDVSLDGGGCPDGDCDDGADQTGNVGTGISSTAKGIEINSENNSKNYNAKYGAKDGNNKIISREQITKQVRNSMKNAVKGAKLGGGIATLTFGFVDVYRGVKQDGNQWGYNTNLAIGRTIGGGFGSYYLGNLGMKLGTVFGGGPGVGTVTGGVVGAGAGGYFGSMFGEFIVKSVYGNE